MGNSGSNSSGRYVSCPGAEASSRDLRKRAQRAGALAHLAMRLDEWNAPVAEAVRQVEAALGAVPSDIPRLTDFNARLARVRRELTALLDFYDRPKDKDAEPESKAGPGRSRGPLRAVAESLKASGAVLNGCTLLSVAEEVGLSKPQSTKVKADGTSEEEKRRHAAAVLASNVNRRAMKAKGQRKARARGIR